MFCPHCGKEAHAEGTAFCPNTGAPLGASPTMASASSPTESCQIQHWTHQKTFSTMTYFWADAIGPKGKYSAGESARVKGLIIKETMLQDAHAALVQRLIADGWKPSPDRGVNWWELRFSR